MEAFWIDMILYFSLCLLLRWLILSLSYDLPCSQGRCILPSLFIPVFPCYHSAILYLSFPMDWSSVGCQHFFLWRFPDLLQEPTTNAWHEKYRPDSCTSRW